MNQHIFDNVFLAALAEWPDPISIDIENFGDAWGERYSSSSIYEISQSLQNKSDYLENAAYMSTMHHAIFIVIHKIAPYCSKIEKFSIRREAVKLIFDKRLGIIAKGDGFDWPDEQISLAKDYFRDSNR
jgi:hypothetical protein